MATAQLHTGPGVGRLGAASLAVGAVAGCALVAAVDPTDSDVLPGCPTQAIFGIDCPACGTMRGLHALTRGRLGTALDHNVLLLVAVPVGLLVWWRWARTAIGRPLPRRVVPDWVVPAAVAVAIVFAAVRNVDVAGLRWLASSA